MLEEEKKKVRETKKLVRKSVYLDASGEHFVGLLTAVEKWGVRLTWKNGNAYEGEVFNWKDVRHISETRVKREMPSELRGGE